MTESESSYDSADSIKNSNILQRVIDCIDPLIFSVDLAYRYTSFNKGHADIMSSLYGCQIEVGKSILDYVTVEADRENLKTGLDRVFQGESVIDGYSPGGSDPSKPHYNLSYKPLLDDKGEITGIFVIGRDTTELNRIKETIQDSTERFKAVFEGSLDGILIADVETRKFKYSNPSISTMLGYKPEELKHLSVLDIHPIESLPNVLKQFERQANGGLPIAPDLPVKRKDGSIFFADIISYPVKFGGGKDHLVGIFRDITERKQLERSLFESNQMFKTIFESSNDGIFLVDLKSRRFQMCNKSCLGLLGYTKDEFLNLDINDIHFPEDLPFIFEQIEKEMLGREAERRDTRFRTKDGSTIYADMNPSTFTLDDRRYVLISFKDITDRKWLEDNLKESKEYLDNIINSIADPIFVKDRNHLWVLLNDSFCDFMGYPREIILGKSDPEFFPKEQADIFWAKDEEAFLSGKTNVNEEKFTDSSGVLHTIVTKKTIYKGPLGNEFLIGVIRDITEMKKIEESLRESRNYLDNIINSVADPIFVKDENFRFVLVNDALCKLVGLGRDDILGKTLGESLPQDQMDHFLRVDKQVIESGQESKCEEPLTCYDGKIHTIVTRKTRYIDIYGRKFVVGVIRDITDQKALEDEL